MRIALCILIWSALATTTVMADSPAVRLSVIGDESGQGFAGLLATELADRSNISLVDRDDLTRFGDESKVAQLAAGDAVALGKQVGVDGLISIEKTTDGFHVRLTSVGLGYALLDDKVSSDANLTLSAKAMANRVAAYASKLKLNSANAIPISVLNLHPATGSPEADLLERKLTLLLESRLASQPDYVVLERRRGLAQNAKHSLSSDPKLLPPESCVVDGTLNLSSGESGDVIVRLHVNFPTSQPAPVEIHGQITDLPGLAEKLASEIEKTTGASAPVPAWQPAKEARGYLEEGIWGWQNNEDVAALDALDSAELFGEQAPDLVPVRIGVLSSRASHALDEVKKNPTASSDDQPVNPIIDDILRAIAEAARYDAGNMQAKLELVSWQQHGDLRAEQIKENLSNFSSDLLLFLDIRHSPRADELRKQLRAITGYDPLHGKLGRADLSNPLNVLTDSKDEWDLTLTEELAYYRLLCTTPHQFIPPDFLTRQGGGFCQRFLKTLEEQKQAFNQLVEDLKGDPKGQLAYQLIRSCSPDPAIADPAYTAYWLEMWNQREQLVTQKVQVQEWTSSRPVSLERRRQHASEMIPVLRYYLDNVNNYRYWEYSWDIMWQPDQWTEVEATEIWSDYLGFKQRAEADHFARGHGGIDMAEVEGPFQRKFPDIAAMKALPQITGPLVVNHLWHPWLSPGAPKDLAVVLPQCGMTGDKLCVEATFNGPGTEKKTFIYTLSLPEFTTQIINQPEPMTPGHLTSTSKAIYLDYQPRSGDPQANSHRIGRYDLATQRWTSRPEQLPFDAFYAIDDSLYLSRKGGIERYDWNASKFTVLASSHRRPATNQFDGRDDYQVNDIFAGPDGKPCVTTKQDGTVYIQDGPGKWPDVFDSDSLTMSACGQNGTLVYSPNGEVVLLDPTQPGPDYLMCPTEAHIRKVASGQSKAVKDMTPWAGQALWDSPDHFNLGDFVGGDSRCFFMLLMPDDNRKSYQLLWYDDRHGRTPRLIPLQFVVDEKTRAALPALYRGQMGDRWSVDSFQRPGYSCNLRVITARDGICLNSDDLGIWFLSYADIETYLKTHATEEPEPAASPIAVTNKIPPPQEDAQSQVFGEMVDPADRTISMR